VGPRAEEKGADGASLGDSLIPQQAFPEPLLPGIRLLQCLQASTHFVVVGHSLKHRERSLGSTVTNLSCAWHYRDARGRARVTRGTLRPYATHLLRGPQLPLGRDDALL